MRKFPKRFVVKCVLISLKRMHTIGVYLYRRHRFCYAHLAADKSAAISADEETKCHQCSGMIASRVDTFVSLPHFSLASTEFELEERKNKRQDKINNNAEPRSHSVGCVSVRVWPQRGLNLIEMCDRNGE